jgi:hypothetical protein
MLISAVGGHVFQRLLSAVGLVLLVSNVAAATKPAELTVTLEGSAVVVDGVSSRGDVVIWGLSRIPKQYHSRTQTTSEIRNDDNGDGSVRLEVDYAIPLQSQWLAVDLETGRIAVASSQGFAPELKGLGSDRLKKASNGRLRRLELAMGDVEVLWIRPGIGAWLALTHDGAANDEDGRLDGRFTLPLEQLRPLGAAPPPPDGFENGDILAVGDTTLISMLVLGGAGK